MNNLCTDIGYYSLIKHGEELCGDHVVMIQPDDATTTLVLADGLGSGVKANILSTLTSKILSTMIMQGMSIEDCISTVVSTLPVCSVRKIAYSTFTIIHVINNEVAEIIQYDNPFVILLRNGKNVELPMTSIEIDGKTIYRSRVTIQEGDVFIAMSDGVIHAGVGMTLNYGWERKNVIEYMEMMYDDSFTAKTLTTILLDECSRLYDNEPSDDVTVCTVKIRTREPMNLMIGPPADRNDDNKMLALFFAKEGKHIICGGTTASLAARYLGKTVTSEMVYYDDDIPPISKIEGVDLVTEGVITFSKVLEYAKNYLEDNESYTQWSYKKDGASLIAQMLFEEATDINFYVGRAINPAHQNPDLPITFSIKMRLVEELAECLKKMGKRIKVSYF